MKFYLHHIHVISFHNFLMFHLTKGLSWSGSYGRWIYNFSVQSVPITTEIVSLNPVHGTVYLIQHYVIKFVHGFFYRYLVSSTNKTDHQRYSWNIVESGVKHHKPIPIKHSMVPRGMHFKKKVTNQSTLAIWPFLLHFR